MRRSHIPWQHLFSIDLVTHADAVLLGIDASGQIHVEELRPEEFNVRSVFAPDGTLLAQADEQRGAELPALPAQLMAPRPAQAARALQLSGPRWRGLREADHIAELAQPLSIHEKMALAQRLHLSVPPPAILGIAESSILSEATLAPDDPVVLVCRRLRIAIALGQTRLDEDGEPYDYDTLPLYVAHLYDPVQSEAPALDTLFAPLWGVTLRRPLDCVQHEDRLVLVEGGSSDQPGRVHAWVRP